MSDGFIMEPSLELLTAFCEMPAIQGDLHIRHVETYVRGDSINFSFEGALITCIEHARVCSYYEDGMYVLGIDVEDVPSRFQDNEFLLLEVCTGSFEGKEVRQLLVGLLLRQRVTRYSDGDFNRTEYQIMLRRWDPVIWEVLETPLYCALHKVPEDEKEIDYEMERGS